MFRLFYNDYIVCVSVRINVVAVIVILISFVWIAKMVGWLLCVVMLVVVDVCVLLLCDVVMCV